MLIKRIRLMFGFKLSPNVLNFVRGVITPSTYKEYGFVSGSNQMTTINGNSFYTLSGAGDYQRTIATLNFVTTQVNQEVQVEIVASSQANSDYMCAMLLDNDSNTKSAVKVSGTESTTYTYTVATPGSHYIKFMYSKDGSGSANQDKGYFRLVPFDNEEDIIQVPQDQQITVKSYGGFKVLDYPNWVVVNPLEASKGNKTIDVHPLVNNGDARTGVITIRDAKKVKDYEVVITQEESPNLVKLSRNAFFEYGSESDNKFTVSLTNNDTWHAAYTGDHSWFTLSKESGVNNDEVTISWNSNTASAKRECRVSIIGNNGGQSEILIAQEPVYCSCDCNGYCTCDCNSQTSACTKCTVDNTTTSCTCDCQTKSTPCSVCTIDNTTVSCTCDCQTKSTMCTSNCKVVNSTVSCAPNCTSDSCRCDCNSYCGDACNHCSCDCNSYGSSCTCDYKNSGACTCDCNSKTSACSSNCKVNNTTVSCTCDCNSKTTACSNCKVNNSTVSCSCDCNSQTGGGCTCDCNSYTIVCRSFQSQSNSALGCGAYYAQGTTTCGVVMPSGYCEEYEGHSCNSVSFCKSESTTTCSSQTINSASCNSKISCTCNNKQMCSSDGCNDCKSKTSCTCNSKSICSSDGCNDCKSKTSCTCYGQTWGSASCGSQSVCTDYCYYCGSETSCSCDSKGSCTCNNKQVCSSDGCSDCASKTTCTCNTKSICNSDGCNDCASKQTCVCNSKSICNSDGCNDCASETTCNCDVHQNIN